MLQDAQQGDHDAFADILAALEPQIRRFVRRLTRSSDSVDDIVQDTFIALYRNLDRINPASQLRPYAYGIARRRCYDDMRRKARQKYVTFEDEPDFDAPYFSPIIADDAAAPDETAHWLLLNLEVQRAIDRLPEVQRQVLILLCEQDLTYEEIAEIMGTNVGTIKSRVHYAKRALRGLMRPEILDAIQQELNDD
ncbi:RNA polymerase sigma factor [Geitlerinema splendidum]|jgi:RNA polymerase sigma-70 factor (ECF subfamily)|nr:RNA polymerase sigma factor [Geitlerinema splendidum]